jgi:predicted metal-dependent phosphoesterase TrpH
VPAPVIDLHTHSTASDGTDTPAELVAAARAAGLDVVALTDHDTTAGWERAAAALPAGLTLIPGAEVSCVTHDPAGRPIPLHVLAYLFDPRHEAFRAERRRLRESRLSRGQLIVDRLAAAGLPVSWDRVRELAASAGAVGRPHIGRALVDAGVVDSVREAFELYLHSGSPYYVPKAEIDAVAAVRLVRAAGGVPVFAHPLARRRGQVVTDAVIAEMGAAGLAGVEADHPDHDEADRAHLRGLAAELGLLVTGSSDYHGRNKDIPLGAHRTAPAAYEALLAQASGSRPVAGMSAAPAPATP